MTRIQREIEIARLVTTHPGWTTAQLAHVLGLTDAQAESAVGDLLRRGVICRVDNGWERRKVETVRSWRRDAPVS